MSLITYIMNFSFLYEFKGAKNPNVLKVLIGVVDEEVSDWAFGYSS